jgi:tetratricopeptide (TPR) repeat protein
MLYFILPPIIIVVCVSALIFFLFRKSEDISFRETVVAQADQARSQGGMSKIMSVFWQFLLKVLERAVHRLKLMSLKFHNTSNDWFHSIREKRERRVRQQEDTNSVVETREAVPRSVEEEISKNITPEIRSRFRQALRPMVREVAVVADTKQAQAKTKGQLEEVLIKRIAMNPKDIEAYERLGDYYMESGSYQDSIECFKQVLRLSPTHTKARTRIRRLEKMIR